MNIMRTVLLLVGTSIALASFVSHSEPATPVVVASLTPPKGETLLLRAFAQGVQIYECAAAASGTQWAFKGPEAALADEHGKPLGKHYGGPTWESTDGSKVVGHPVASVDSSDPTAIAHLLLKADSHTGYGVFAGVTSVQRLQTAGGRAPKEACDAKDIGRQARVPYSATYYFYGEDKVSGY
jgi:hypothetical protein